MNLIKFLRISLLVMFNVLVTILLLELTLRYIYTPQSVSDRIAKNAFAVSVGNQQKAIFSYEYLRYQPNTVADMNHAEYSIQASHDRVGFRNPCLGGLSLETEVLLVGDSFVYGVGLPDDDTYGCKLINKGFHVYTIGVPGFDPSKYVEVLEKNASAIKEVHPNIRDVYMVIFLGNDFESLMNFSARNKKEGVALDAEGFSDNLLNKINYFVTTSKNFGQSYALAGMKLLLKPLLRSSNMGGYIVNYAGSTFYKQGENQPIGMIKKSLSLMRDRIGLSGLELKKVFLVEDPAALFKNKLELDMRLANYDPSKIDTNFKFETVLNACSELDIRCYSTGSIFVQGDYYQHDNHLTPAGAEKLADFIYGFRP